MNLDTTLGAEWGVSSDNQRLLLGAEDLARWLSAQFRTYPGCEAVTVLEVIPLDKPDHAGCNWSRALFLDSGGASPTDYAPAYAAIVDMARDAFNLKT